jgi:hypothetical protein
VLAEEFTVLDAASPLWNSARPLVDVALRLEQNDDSYVWHGWQKHQIEAFLKSLPEHCTLLIGVWETNSTRSIEPQDRQEQEVLHLGCVCEVIRGEMYSIRTFVALTDADADLPPMNQLEPGYQHALELMRAARIQVAPVAWALFTDKLTWDAWLFTEDEHSGAIDKGEVLTAFARQGRCVLMGSQTVYHHI